VSRKRKKPPRKRKKPTRKRKVDRADGVIDLDLKRAEKITEKLSSLGQAVRQRLDEQVAHIVGAYRKWEQTHPDLALKPRHKLAMVRLGFVGPGGFERCHEPGRLPESAFFLEDGDVSEQIRRDHKASEVLMCPAMQAGVCQGAWRGMRMPPCYLLLLEVHHGLGGGALDDSVQEVVDDFGKWGGPEEYADSFARAEQTIRKHDEGYPSS
jgi:hypothetical protein